MTFVSGKFSTLVWSHWMYVSFAAVTTGAVGHMVSSKSNVSTKSPLYSSPPPHRRPRVVDASRKSRGFVRGNDDDDLDANKTPSFRTVVVVFRFAATTARWWCSSATRVRDIFY